MIDYSSDMFQLVMLFSRHPEAPLTFTLAINQIGNGENN